MQSKLMRHECCSFVGGGTWAFCWLGTGKQFPTQWLYIYDSSYICHRCLGYRASAPLAQQQSQSQQQQLKQQQHQHHHQHSACCSFVPVCSFTGFYLKLLPTCRLSWSASQPAACPPFCPPACHSFLPSCRQWQSAWLYYIAGNGCRVLMQSTVDSLQLFLANLLRYNIS